MNLLSSLLISFLVQSSFFILAASFKTDKVTDLSYGLSFVIIGLALAFLNPGLSLVQWLVVGAVVLWGVRLAGYLFIRILKIKKDKRFDGIRENFAKFAQFWFFQALSVWAIMIPVTIFLSAGPVGFGLGSLIGLVIWGSGLGLETVADWQKFVFKNDPKNKGKWIESGVWTYSRHPNYFGEMMVWWGLFLTIMSGLGLGFWWLVIGPLYISTLLLFVTGVPTLEKKYDERYKGDKEYQRYKRETSLLVPWFKKSQALQN